MAKKNILHERISDVINRCLTKDRAEFLGFLNEQERAKSEKILHMAAFSNFRFWGGFEQAQRVLLGLFPSWQEADSSLFELDGLFFSVKSYETLTHRDILGAVLSLGIERNSIGDIVLLEDKIVIFAKKSVANFISSSLQKAKHSSLKFMQNYSEKIDIQPKYKQMSSTIASERLDCVLGAILRKSREKSCEVLRLGFVKLNYLETYTRTQKVKNGDIISVKGYGKFRVNSIENKTKKDRLKLEFEKFI